MRRLAFFPTWILLLIPAFAVGSYLDSLGVPDEEHLLILRNGGVVAGVLPQIGGRVMVFRTDAGENVLDERRELWKETSSSDLLSMAWKQRYGESIWAGPQGIWWTAEEPYPPSMPRKVNSPTDNWPPDPAWETAPFSVSEKTPTRMVLRGPISQLTGLQLTRTIELLPDGKLRIHATAVNKGDRVVARDLWFVHRVPMASRCFLPLKSETAENGFADAASLQKIEGLTVLEQQPPPSPARLAYGKMFAVPDQTWMATALRGVFFIVHFQPVDTAKVAAGQAPIEVFCSSAPDPLCEMEHHTEMKTLKPGEKMESEEIWQIVPDKGPADADAQARFLRANLIAR